MRKKERKKEKGRDIKKRKRDGRENKIKKYLVCSIKGRIWKIRLKKTFFFSILFGAIAGDV